MNAHLENILLTIRKWYDNPKSIERDKLYNVLGEIDKVDKVIKMIDTALDDAYLSSYKKTRTSVVIDAEIRTWIREKLEEEYPIDRYGYLGTRIIDKNFNFSMILKNIIKEEMKYYMSNAIDIEIEKHKEKITNEILEKIRVKY